MKERPILFSTSMVQALLDGRKSQTRRIIKPQPDENGVSFRLHPPFIDWEQVYNETWKPWHWDDQQGEHISKDCSPYGQPGDLLWVRETCSYFKQGNGTLQREKTHYKADKRWDGNDLIKWKPSIHMPKAAARIWLMVKHIGVEPLDYIGEFGALKEGVEFIEKPGERPVYRDYCSKDGKGYLTPSDSFKSLWQSLHGPKSWRENPWVWVVTFDVISKNGRPDDEFIGNVLESKMAAR